MAKISKGQKSRFKPLVFIAITFLLLFGVNTEIKAASLGSFESDGNEIYTSPSSTKVSRKSDTYYWQQYSGGKSYSPEWGYLEIDNTNGAKGTKSSLKMTVTGGRTNPYKTPVETCGQEITNKQQALENPDRICSSAGGGFYFYFKDDTNAHSIPNSTGKNRISFWAKLPKFDQAFHHSGEPENYTMHFGTYSRNPEGSYDASSNKGRHFYHYLNFRGTGEYWTKIIIDEHPQHEVSTSGDPGDQPTSHGYIEGISRFYFKQTANILSTPWSIWIDEIEIYHDPRPMPPKIANIAITQVGPIDFEINFASTDEGGGDSYVNKFEVRYSTLPINQSNFYDAEIVSGSPAITGDYERYAHCEAYDLNINDANTVYFAVRQTDENTDKIAYAEYELSSSPQSTIPRVPLNLRILNANQYPAPPSI